MENCNLKCYECKYWDESLIYTSHSNGDCCTKKDIDLSNILDIEKV